MLQQLSPRFYLLFFNIIFVWPSAWCFVTDGLIWSTDQQVFVNLYSLDWCAELRRDFLESTNTFTKNCNGEKIRVGYYQDGNLINFYDNDTKVNGLFGELWNIFAHHLNFTLVPVRQPVHDIGTRVCNNTHTGLLGLLERKEIDAIATAGLFSIYVDVLDYTVPVATARHKLYIRPVYKLDNTWIITLMSPITWYCVFFLLIVISVVGYILHTTPSPKNKSTDVVEQRKFTLFEHIFYTFSLLCSQGYVPSVFYNRYKLFSISKSIFCWLTLIAYSANLINRMTNRTLSPPFTGFETLINSTNFKLLTLKGSMVLNQLQNIVNKAAVTAGIVNVAERIVYMETAADMYRKVCFSNDSYAMFDLVHQYNLNGRFVCSLLPVGPSYFETWVIAAVAKGFRYKKLLNSAVMELRQHGIITALRYRYLGLKMDNTPPNTFRAIDVDQVHLIFLILYCGIGISVVIFVLEYITFLSKMECDKKITRKNNVTL